MVKFDPSGLPIVDITTGVLVKDFNTKYVGIEAMNRSRDDVSLDIFIYDRDKLLPNTSLTITGELLAGRSQNWTADISLLSEYEVHLFLRATASSIKHIIINVYGLDQDFNPVEETTVLHKKLTIYYY